MERMPWIAELIQSESLEETVAYEPRKFHRSIAAFWQAPEAMVEDLIDVARSWFRMLLRYTYRVRYRHGRERSLAVFELDEVSQGHVVSQMKDYEVYNLTQRPNRYGATYYRQSYKDTKSRQGWTQFCTRVKRFCQTVGLPSSSSNLEHVLEDFRHGLPQIIADRRLNAVTPMSQRNFNMARKTDSDAKKLTGQITSTAVHADRSVAELQDKIEELSRLIAEVAVNDNNAALDTLKQGFENLRNDVMRLHEQSVLSAGQNEEVQQDVEDLRYQIERLEDSTAISVTSETTGGSQRQHNSSTGQSTYPSVEPEAHPKELNGSLHIAEQMKREAFEEDRSEYEKRIQLLQDELKSHRDNEKRIQLLQGELKSHRDKLELNENELRSRRLDHSLMQCRILIETLLPEWPEDQNKGKGKWKPRGNEYAKRWRELLFQKEWERCKKERPEGHPLLEFIGDERYYKTGEGLYGILSKGFHSQQGSNCDGELGPDALRMVFAILPADWEAHRQWDEETEKRRWGLTV